MDWKVVGVSCMELKTIDATNIFFFQALFKIHSNVYIAPVYLARMGGTFIARFLRNTNTDVGWEIHSYRFFLLFQNAFNLNLFGRICTSYESITKPWLHCYTLIIFRSRASANSHIYVDKYNNITIRTHITHLCECTCTCEFSIHFV